MNLRSAEDSAAFIHDEGGTAKVIVADVSEPNACEAMVGEATELLGGLDGLVLNVGIGRPRTSRRLRGRSPGNPGQRGRTRVDRHPSGASARRGRPGRTEALVALRRQGTAWEVAAPVVFLLRDEAGYVTGQILAVDGGLSTV
jgi:NAD(P)-dependent dehydrogenase (short-subunit alcohol dehydrogenase family)